MSLWVFAYGSLLWDPSFAPVEQVKARLDDYHRSFCMLSIHHRGTVERPGLVLALDAAAGATCTGLALKVAPEEEAAVLAMLRERELISSAYLEARVPLTLADGRRVEAVTYVVDRTHPQYCILDLEDQAQRISAAVGGRGPNPDYLWNTVRLLDELQIEDGDLRWLSERVESLTKTP